jgi:hypothetical protein
MECRIEEAIKTIKMNDRGGFATAGPGEHDFADGAERYGL